MSKITVVSYCHEAHKLWISSWAEQINRQTFRDFNILFIPHNWGEHNIHQSGTNAGFVWDAIEGKMDDDLRKNIAVVSHWSPPVIGEVIDFACGLLIPTGGADGPYLAHWDVDDVLHPERLRLQHDFLVANPDTDFLGTRMVGFYGDPTPEMLELSYVEPNEPNLDVTDHDDIKRCILDRGQNCLGHTTMIYRPEVMLALGGFSRSDVKLDGKSPDFETWKKALMAGYKFHRLPELCALWRLDSSSIRHV